MQRVLLIGANGFVGRAVARALSEAGFDVTGLARSSEKAAELQQAGLKSVGGDLEDLAKLADIADRFDAVITAAVYPFDKEFAYQSAIADRFSGSGRTLITTSGTAVLSIETPNGEWREETFAEDEPVSPAPWMQVRLDTENQIRSYKARNVRAMVIRPPMIWGHGESFQIPAIFDSVKDTGAACYFKQGLNLYSHVHVDDLAQVYLLALQKGAAGAVYHAVAGEANWREIANAVATVKKCGTQSIDKDEAERLWGERRARLFFGVSSRSKARRTRSELGWVPRKCDVVDDILNGSYKEKYGEMR